MASQLESYADMPTEFFVDGLLKLSEASGDDKFTDIKYLLKEAAARLFAQEITMNALVDRYKPDDLTEIVTQYLLEHGTQDIIDEWFNKKT